MSAPYRPSVNASGTPWLASMPQLPWSYSTGGVGGSNVSASGTPASFVIRTDYLAVVTIRALEQELPALLREVEYARDHSAPILFAFDQDDDYTSYECYLDSPVWPNPLEPERDDAYLGLFRLQLRLRTVDGLPFETRWAEDVATL